MTTRMSAGSSGPTGSKGPSLSFNGGPLDGMTMVWPGSATDFPSLIQFGFYLPIHAIHRSKEDSWNAPNKLAHHRYYLGQSFVIGAVDDDHDLFSEHAVHSYYHDKCDIEVTPSVAELWDRPEA